MNMIDKVQETMMRFGMVKEGDSLLCGLSGGADSTALLLCLKQCGYNVRACHVNHQLRGEESMRDEKFCEELCKRLDIPLTVKRVDVKSYAKKRGLSIEMAARSLRYQAFGECRCDKVATAHTLSDCLETTIFHLARGTGLTGLAAIPPIRGKIIRPMIECTHEEIVEFLKSRGQDWVTDSSNLNNNFTRNKIRNQIIPLLKEINGSLEKTYAGTLENFRDEDSFISNLAEGMYMISRTENGFDCQKLVGVDYALAGRVFKRILAENGVECTHERVEELRDICYIGGKITLGTNLYAVSDGKYLRVEKGFRPAKNYELKPEIGVIYTFFDKKFMLESLEADKSPCKIENVHKSVTKNYADYDKIDGEIVVRNRRPGDRIKFAGNDYTTSVKKLFQSNLSREERSRQIMLADSKGLIFVEGYGFADRVKADESTKTVLHCKISPDYHNESIE